MKTLNVNESYKHLIYTLIVTKRTGDIVMAEAPIYGAEVFKIRRRPAKTLSSGNTLEPGEYPPCTSKWGTNAHHYLPKYRELASLYFNDLVGKYNSPPSPTS